MTTLNNTFGDRSAPSTRSFAQTHALLIYFGLAFALSWGGVLAVVGPGGIPATREEFDPLFPLVYLAMLTGPSIAGVLSTALVDGRAGFRSLRDRLLNWRVGWHWYAVALLIAPILTTLVSVVLGTRSRDFLPSIVGANDKAVRIAFGLGVGLGAGVFEELGWTGFAVPRLRKHRSVLTSGLVLGLLWGAWHLLAQLWGSTDFTGPIPLPALIAMQLFTFLPAYRVLMVWVYERTDSLSLAMLMHASLTTCAIVLGPASTSGTTLAIYDATLAGMIWVILAGISLTNRGRLWRYRARSRA